jgi:CxxC motif-containing protein
MAIARDFNKKPGDSAEIICVICPNSCRLHVSVDDNYDVLVEGNQCKRGLEYGKQEYLDPKRTLITTMRIEGGFLPLLPVRSNKEMPKGRIFEAVEEITKKSTKTPIKMGDVIIPNIFGLGIDIIASRSMESK